MPEEDDLLRNAPPLRRQISGLVNSYKLAYQKLRIKYQQEKWTFSFNLKKQFQLWKSLEVLAYYLCRDRSRPVYTNYVEMRRIFGINELLMEKMDYRAYNKLCMRFMLGTFFRST